MQLAKRLQTIFAINPQSWALEFEGHRWSWEELSGVALTIAAALRAAGLKEHDVVGWAAQNVPSSVASLTGLVLSGHCACVLNPHMAPQVLADEIRTQRFPLIIGDPQFWAIPGVVEAARASGSAGIVASWSGLTTSIEPYPGLEFVGPESHRDPMPGFVIERVSSGTTGPPKRTPQREEAVLASLSLGQRKEAGVDEGPPRLSQSPALVIRPLAHSGSFAVLLALYSGRPISLHEKFDIERTVDAIGRYRPKVLSLVPAMIRMIWDAQVPPELLSSLIAIRTGTAPLDSDLQQAFEDKYGVPILCDYGATEFGGVAGWSLADHKRYSREKRGSAGRPIVGAQIRVMDPVTGEQILDGGVGLLEVQVDKKTSGWVGTNDLARIDEDGFLFIHGRADDAIVRGGFKVLPEEVANVLRRFPGVEDAAVVGVPDARLGHVPVAVIELRDGERVPDEGAVKAFAREHLTPYQVPVAVKFVDKLPRTVSMKIIRSELLALAMN
ncbi:acyl--CoA ligase [Sphingobium sp. TB-6]|uniref:class I adenylate-forming enzyme family protein n=1 Tax=Sphingobium sp. TB-6 TaxID=2728850 RepID=UPI00146F2BB5|nr:class I adenylate-forming enzyme family protein [Sphingobium sp. TB-6]NML87656.1 acyl--CoA ligase [Sphingobium sp. TB-6]